MAKQSILAAEMSDVNAVASELRNAVSLLSREVAEQRINLEKLAASSAALETRLNTVDNTCRQIASALASGGSLQQTFQNITESHFDRVNRRLAGFEGQVQKGIEATGKNVDSSAAHAKEAERVGSHSQEMLERAQRSVDDLRRAANHLGDSMHDRDRALREEVRRADNLLKSLQELEAASRRRLDEAEAIAGRFDDYQRQARWTSFWGRLMWLLRGAPR